MILGTHIISCNFSEVLYLCASMLLRDFRKQFFSVCTLILIHNFSHLCFVDVFMLVGGYVSSLSHLSQAQHSSSDTPYSAILDHLRTLLVFYLLHNHLTLLHKSPSTIIPEELCRSFYWFQTFCALKYPQCFCPLMHPPWLAG